MQTCAQLIAALLAPALNINHDIEGAVQAFSNPDIPQIVVNTPFEPRGWFPTRLKPVDPSVAMYDTVEDGFLALLDKLKAEQDKLGYDARVTLVLSNANRDVAGVFVFAPQTESDDIEQVQKDAKRGPFISLYDAPPSAESSSLVPECRGCGDWLFWIAKSPNLMIKITNSEKTRLWGKNAPINPPSAPKTE